MKKKEEKNTEHGADLLGLLSHAGIIISVMLITFDVTDYFNRPMAFINNRITKALIFALAILCIIQSLVIIAHLRREKLQKYTEENRKKDGQ